MAAEVKGRPVIRQGNSVAPVDLERILRHYDEQIKQLVEDKDSLQSQITALDARVTELE